MERHYPTWDAEHYLYLAEFGYDKDVRSCAFFPLWPLAIRGGAILAGGSYVIAGMVLANLFSVAGGCLFYRILWRRYGSEVAWCSLCFLMLFPGSVFYQFIYSESLFSAVAGEMAAGVEVAEARAQAGNEPIAGKAGGVVVSIVIAVVSGGGLGLLSGADVPLDGKPF